MRSQPSTRRADLVPVFSFGENDVSASFLIDVVRTFTGLRSTSKCPINLVPRYTVYRKDFSLSLASRCPCFMGEGSWIVRIVCRFVTILIYWCPYPDNIGLMPYRRQIVAVSKWNCPSSFGLCYSYRLVGNPIHVQQCDNPDIEEITRIQRMYIEELTRYVKSG